MIAPEMPRTEGIVLTLYNPC